MATRVALGVGQASNVPAWPGEARHQAQGHRVAHDRPNDRDRPSCLSGGLDRDSSRHNQDINPELDEGGQKSWVPIKVAVCPSVLDGNVLPFDPSMLSQPLPERFQRRRELRRVRVAKEPDPIPGPGSAAVGHGTRTRRR